MDSVGLTGSLNDVIGGAGMLVAVGGSGSAAISFVSTDGATWTAAPEQEALQGAEMTSVAFRNGAFVATGLLTGPGDTFPSTPAISSLRFIGVLFRDPPQHHHLDVVR